jgi:alpha(1,3/1,4) fucosyltransferase
MRVIVQNHYDFITTNGYLFTNPESDIGAGLLKPWNELYLAAKARGIDLFTPDQHDEGDLLILLDRPTQIKATAPRTIAVLYEPSVIIPNNYDKDFLDSCEKVFTWDDELVDEKKFIKSNFTVELQNAPLHAFHESFKSYHARKLLCMMNTYKQSSHPRSLYGKRMEALRFFTGHAPEDFDLWGRNWQGHNLSTYRGATNDKLKTLANYRFCLAYENCDNTYGYISEKMLDCFMVGVVPVYWGALNVREHIPPECFVDIKDFASYEELYKFLSDMPHHEYMGYIDAINKFITSPDAEQFYNTHFVDTLLQHMEKP